MSYLEFIDAHKNATCVRVKKKIPNARREVLRLYRRAQRAKFSCGVILEPASIYFCLRTPIVFKNVEIQKTKET